jgi:hypothetical protein
MEMKPASTETMGLKTLKWKMWTISLNDDEGNATTTPSLEGELKGVRGTGNGQCNHNLLFRGGIKGDAGNREQAMQPRPPL